MLEHPCLRLAPWTRADAAWIRAVTDAAGGAVGFARFVGKSKSSWFSWLRGMRLDVYETDDASHLMTLIRPWGMFRIWDVYDADEQRIGSIYPPSIVDSNGERRGYLDLRGRENGQLISPYANGDGVAPLATFQSRLPHFLEVTFAHDPAANPFLRMLLLAAVLAQDPSPPR